jgi:hypothetical protein
MPVQRSPEQIEKRRIADRERKRRKYQEDPEFRTKELERGALRDKTKEAERKRKCYAKTKEIQNARRTAWGRKNRERQLAAQRDHYARNREKLLEIIKERRYRKDPIRGLWRAITDCEQGRIGLDDLYRRYSTALERLDERINSQQASERRAGL